MSNMTNMSEEDRLDLNKLEYYQRQHARRTLIARIVLLTVIIGTVGLNGWMMNRNYETMIINMDQARLAQDQLHEETQAQVAELTAQVAELQKTLSRMEAQQAVGVAVAAR